MKMNSFIGMLLMFGLIGVFPMESLAQSKSGFGGPRGGYLLLKLSKEKELRYHEVMRNMHEKKQGLNDKAQTIQKELDNILVNDKFDEKTYRNKSAELRDLKVQMMQNHEEAVVELAKEFNQQERKVLVEHFDSKGPGKKAKRSN